MTIGSAAAPVKATRQRRAPVEMRAHVIRAASDLLQSEGPQALTLKAVALRAGIAHGSVTYHFGTVEALHTALIAASIADLTAAVAVAVAHVRQDELAPRDVVDVVFDAFAAGGVGRLAAWLVATGAGHRLAPLYAAVAELVGGLAQGQAGERAGGVDAIGLMVASVAVPALGDALIGPGLEEALGLNQGVVRQVVADTLTRLITR